MRKIGVTENLSLDGVMQAPGGKDEDPRGGFSHGGWAQPYDDPVKRNEMGKGMSKPHDMLFGRRTYEHFYKVWAGRTDNPFTPVLESAQKYVVSRTLTEPLSWKNSTLLTGGAADTVARLRQQPGNDLVVLGSGELVQTLIRHDLVDEYILLIYPLVLGPGRRLFPEDGAFGTLRLADSATTTKGVVIATYRRAEGETP